MYSEQMGKAKQKYSKLVMIFKAWLGLLSTTLLTYLSVWGTVWFKRAN